MGVLIIRESYSLGILIKRESYSLGILIIRESYSLGVYIRAPKHPVTGSASQVQGAGDPEGTGSQHPGVSVGMFPLVGILTGDIESLLRTVIV